MRENKYKLIVFDLDGTLLDTLEDLAASVNYAMEKLGLPLYTVEQVRWMVGNGAEVLMKRAVTEKHIDKYSSAVTLQKEFYAVHSLDSTKEYEGISEMLTALSDAGIQTGVFSNKDDDVVKQLCRDFFGDKVVYAVGTKLNSAKKPDPFGLVEIMRLSGCSACETVYCGDSEVDVMTAANAGVPCVSVTWGFRDKDFLSRHGAKLFADCPSQVTDMVLGGKL